MNKRIAKQILQRVIQSSVIAITLSFFGGSGGNCDTQMCCDQPAGAAQCHCVNLPCPINFHFLQSTDATHPDCPQGCTCH